MKTLKPNQLFQSLIDSAMRDDLEKLPTPSGVVFRRVSAYMTVQFIDEDGETMTTLAGGIGDTWRLALDDITDQVSCLPSGPHKDAALHCARFALDDARRLDRCEGHMRFGKLDKAVVCPPKPEVAA